ncbi:DUF4430 domain-containing protein [Paenibacillus sp. NRS-1760]|uniref:DUF4430 domain-containing protein n=1 Tax=Paenibacillus sp. NRS-1760 TaxID=3233902 RepID=UPI003D2BDAC1
MLNLKRFMKKSLPAILSFVLVFTLFAPQVGKAADHSANASLNEMIDKTVEYYKNRNTTLNSWWEIVALWGAGENLQDGSWKLPSWKTVDPGLKPNDSDTTHIRYIYSLLAMGEDPAHAWETDRNLYAELAAQLNKDTGSFAGSTNRHMWAMHALDTGVKLGSDVGSWDDTSKNKALKYLLSKQLNDGGFAFFGKDSDPDMTGMGLLALGNYQNDSAVQAAIVRVKNYLQTIKLNQENVMYGKNSSSTSAVVSGLTAVGEDMLSDVWMANDKSVLDTYSLFQLQNGAFKNDLDKGSNSIATEQALVALADIKNQKTVWQRLGEIKLPVFVNTKVKVDGISQSIYDQKTVSLKQNEKPVTALDALKKALNTANPPITFNIVNSSIGSYVQGIAGQEAGSFGGWDGWMYEVNGIAPDVGANAYQLKENDEVRFYYSRYPALSTTTKLYTGSVDPTVDVKLVGDHFSSEATIASNWAIDSDASGLTIKSIEKTNDQHIKISLLGKAKDKPFTLQALAAVSESKKESEPFTVSISDSVTVDFQVDGISSPILTKQSVTFKNTEKQVTVLDVFKKSLDQATPKISYKITESSYGPYVSEIAGEAAGSLGGWDGWMYEVNGIVPEVGVDAYELKDKDVVRFYYSRYAALSTQSTITSGAVNPTIDVKLSGDDFTSVAANIDNWSINTGNTELKVKSLVQDEKNINISFEGTAKGGTITVQALGAALVGKKETEPIAVAVPREVSNTTDQNIAIHENEKDVTLGAESNAPVTNNIILSFASAALPKVTAIRGTTTLEIPANTTVTSTWDQKLQLPKYLSTDESGLTAKLNTALSVNNKKVDAIAVRIQAGGNEKIQFNQHVTLTIKGQGDKEAGFVDQAGVFTQIKKYADSSARTDEVYAYNQNGDLIIKTKHFTEFLAYTTTTASTGGDGGTLPVAETITLSVEKRTVSTGDLVAPYTVTLKQGDTAFTALKRVLEEKGVSFKYIGSDSSIYVQAIGGLAEFDHGEKSGWMYSVNGTFPQISAGSYVLKKGDNVRWQYTKDLGADIGATVPGDTGGQVPGKDPEVKPNPSATKYSDESKIASWALEAVNKATALGFMQGTSTSNATFEPKRNLTRAEFAALMVKYSGADPIMEDSGFKDVNSGAWYYGYVKAAKEKGLMSGVTETSFAPNQPITRQEMAAVLVRLKGLADENAPQAAIKDRDAVAAWAVPYVNVAYQKGLMTGDNGKFNPQALVTREMAAVTIIRLHELKS